MIVDLDAVRQHREMYKASHAHDGAFACCTAHSCAEDVPPLLAEIGRLAAERDELDARLTSAHEALAIDEFDGDSCVTLETTIEYAISRYRAVCDSEASAADEIKRLRALVKQAGGECVHGSLARLCGPCSFDRAFDGGAVSR